MLSSLEFLPIIMWLFFFKPPWLAIFFDKRYLISCKFVISVDAILIVFSPKLKEKVKNLPPATVIKYDGVKPTFQIRDKAKSSTVEVKGGK